MKRGMEHDKVERLLPWYANGTLGTGEHCDVARHLEHCETCRDELAFLGDVRGVLRVSATRDQDAPVARTADFHSLPAELQRRVLDDRRITLRKRHWLPAVAAGFMAAVGLGVALTVTWLDAPRYRTATSSGAAANDVTRVAVSFEPGASLHELNTLLQEHDAVVVRVPDADKHWVLEFPGNDTDGLLARLRTTRGVTMAEPVAEGTSAE